MLPLHQSLNVGYSQRGVPFDEAALCSWANCEGPDSRRCVSLTQCFCHLWKHVASPNSFLEHISFVAYFNRQPHRESRYFAKFGYFIPSCEHSLLNIRTLFSPLVLFWLHLWSPQCHHLLYFKEIFKRPIHDTETLQLWGSSLQKWIQ